MWFSFWRSRDRFSLDELRFLVDQLMKVQLVNEVNKDFVIEALRSIAELITYGDQHDPAYFEFFMEKQVMGEFVRILKISRTLVVSRQLLQTMSIMIQNLRCEHSIYYMFSNEHVNDLITYQFDFRNEELLSYYISFLRAISGKLNKDTISLLVKAQTKVENAQKYSSDAPVEKCSFPDVKASAFEKDEVISFPLYVEAIRYAFHEESMIRTAVRALTLNVYHVGDDAVNNFVSREPYADYFVNLVKFFRDQCIHLNQVVSKASKNPSTESASPIISIVDEIEDNLYYFSDIVSAGIPDVGRLITDNILRLLIFPLVLPSLRIEALNERHGAVTSLYLLCCILRILKIKDLANTVAAALCFQVIVTGNCEAKVNGNMLDHDSSEAENHDLGKDKHGLEADARTLQARVISSSSSQNHHPSVIPVHDNDNTEFAPREALLSFISRGDDVQVSGSLCVLATLLQAKELDESMIDALGILPQRKHHKKKLLQALVGEDSGEDQLFSSGSSGVKDGIGSSLDIYLQKLKVYTGVSSESIHVGASPRVHRFQVLDALVSLFCRSNISAETLWDGGWLLRRLLPYSEAEFNSNHIRLLKKSFHQCINCLLEETRGTWSDHLVTIICDEWRKCKRAIEASNPRKDPKLMVLSSNKSTSEDRTSSESSFAAAEKTRETVKMFVLLHHLNIFSVGRLSPDQPPVLSTVEIPERSRGRKTGVNPTGIKPNTEINLEGGLPCRIAFERGKERHFHFLAFSLGHSGWLVLSEEFPMKPCYGIVRVVAPLAGCNPRIDDKHPRWLHLKIRPASFPFADAPKPPGKVKPKAVVDGRWTLAFRDEESSKNALGMVLEELQLQSRQVEKSLHPLLEFDRNLDHSKTSEQSLNNSSS